MILTTEHVKLNTRNGHVKIPTRGSNGASGYDLCAVVKGSETIKPGETKMISSGMKMVIPKGICGLLVPRSGLSTKRGIVLANTIGVIDSDYRGEIKMALMNISDTSFEVTNGLRVAQILFIPTLTPRFEYCSDADFNYDCSTERQGGGFGSTGVS